MSTLDAFPHMDPHVLRGLATGLCKTLEARSLAKAAQDLAHEEQIRGLQTQLEDARNPNRGEAPEGFKRNDEKYPMLWIHVSANDMRPVYWIQECADGKVLGRYRGQPLEEDHWVFEVYAQPATDQAGPITSLPSWYRHMALNSSSGFTTLLDATAEADHPGLYAETLRWRRLDEALRGAQARVNSLEADILSIQTDMGLCEGRLVQAQAHTHVAHLEAVGKASARAHFTALKAGKQRDTKLGRFV
jgi:hypothetical protein